MPRWQKLIASVDDACFAGTLDYTTTKGVAQSLPFAPTLGHVFNHATHHRGQITAAITAMGYPCPEIDWVWMLQAESRRTNDIMTTTLRIERDGPVARVWLDRPEVRNAMNGTLIRELAAAFGALAGEDGVRAIVLGGSGKAFCAGADLAFMREAADYTWEQNHADAAALAEMLWAMYSCPVPVIARIHGDCYAGGLGLASVCDIRVVADAVTFSLSEARLGLLPATISPYVIRAMGEQAARRYFVTAERFGAAEARAMRIRARGVHGGGDRRGGRPLHHRDRRQRPDGDARLQAARPRRRRPRDRRRAARRHRAPHRRHPRQCRRPRRHPELPRQARPGLVDRCPHACS